MLIDFTKIKWAGSDCILITDRENSSVPLLILNRYEIEQLNKEFAKKDINEGEKK